MTKNPQNMVFMTIESTIPHKTHWNSTKSPAEAAGAAGAAAEAAATAAAWEANSSRSAWGKEDGSLMGLIFWDFLGIGMGILWRFQWYI